MSLTNRAHRATGADGRWGRIPRHGLTRLGAAAAASAAAAAAVLALTTSAGASTGSTGTAAAPGQGSSFHVLHLRSMPRGTVTFGRWHGRLTAHVVMFGLAPGVTHAVRLALAGRPSIRFSPLTANSVGQANSVLHSNFWGTVPCASRLVIHLGVGNGPAARQPIAKTKWARRLGNWPHRFIAVEVSRNGTNYGTPHGRATLFYNAARHTLTVTVHATRLTPGPHAAHIHTGSCHSQGPVLYMLRDLIANSQGTVVHAVRVFTNVTKPIPPSGWYLNIHQGNSKTIQTPSGNPTIFFRPLLCRNIH